MSNPVTLTRTIFVNPKDKTEMYGYRMSDNYASTFCDSMVKETLEGSLAHFLRVSIVHFDAEADAMLDNAIDAGGIMIDGEFVELSLENDKLVIGGE